MITCLERIIQVNHSTLQLKYDTQATIFSVKDLCGQGSIHDPDNLYRARETCLIGSNFDKSNFQKLLFIPCYHPFSIISSLLFKGGYDCLPASKPPFWTILPETWAKNKVKTKEEVFKENMRFSPMFSMLTMSFTTTWHLAYSYLIEVHLVYPINLFVDCFALHLNIPTAKTRVWKTLGN